MPDAPATLGLDTPLKRGIFGTYVGLWVSSHLLVYSSRLAGAPEYNATSVVLLTEAVKLAMAVALYLSRDGDAAQLARAIAGSLPLLLKYTVPALLYCVYNNLVYANLASFDPGTYNVLMQLRIVMTGLLYQWLFRKWLRRNQWYAIGLIAAGCMCKEAGKLASAGGLHANASAWLLLLVQMLSSVFAGVYNEALLKGAGGERRGVTTNLQNAYMYFSSIVWNAAFLLAQGRLGEAVSPSNLSAVFTPTVLCIVLIMSTVGLVTGFFLKHLDSVLKSIAAATEVVLTMLASTALFGTPLDALDALSALLVGGGVALYSRPETPRAEEHELVELVAEIAADDADDAEVTFPSGTPSKDPEGKEARLRAAPTAVDR